jgi:hypothetical protein
MEEALSAIPAAEKSLPPQISTRWAPSSCWTKTRTCPVL